jgi:SAM-dependent methyltransferase
MISCARKYCAATKIVANIAPSPYSLSHYGRKSAKIKLMSEPLPSSAPLAPSPWVCRFAGLIPAGGEVLDLACGGGRHARYLAGLGYRVEAVDRDESQLSRLADVPRITTRQATSGWSWPYFGRGSRHRDHLPLAPLDASAHGLSGRRRHDL